MKLTADDVQKIATLARLEIKEEEIARTAEQLSNILSHVQQLNTLKTDSIEPTAHAVLVPTPFRGDEVVIDTAKGDSPKELALANAPDREGNLFKVIKVL
ncbi:MAG: Asp-tRNA(Asn)/Glu-tRNA(Gln) amidotransferase subunit GatC [Deltaproteobacteria bacterium]|nr:Asp-tRNA(Asn)/Glu-tRNA(Gln) amidotransferase subunit GatC [Deltaproteobacteria bacterium]